MISLVDFNVNVYPSPNLPAGHPFVGVQAVGYWSATEASSAPSDAWVVSFSNDLGVYRNGKAATNNRVWCVR